MDMDGDSKGNMEFKYASYNFQIYDKRTIWHIPLRDAEDLNRNNGVILSFLHLVCLVLVCLLSFCSFPFFGVR